MKRLKILIIAVVALCCVSIPASAQFKWGIQAGIVTNDLKFSEKLFDSSNRVGFTGGLTAQFNLIFGLGFQGSVMYVHKESKIETDLVGMSYPGEVKMDYLTVPIHIKYNINLPAINKIFRPYLFTGPSFSYRLSKPKNFSVSKGDIEWDLGLGIELINHLQISAGYGFGCYKIADFQGNEVRTNSWTVTLGYLF